MQFTVIMEFLIPGLAALLLGLALLPCGAIPQLPQAPTGETATALLLLAVSYPVGHLVNFPVYIVLQKWLLVPWARRRTFKRYSETGDNLADLATKQLGFKSKGFSGGTWEERKRLFTYLQALIFSKNINQLNSDHVYHQGLQRLARGMLIPILMAIWLVCRQARPAWGWLVLALSIFFLVCFALLVHSIRREEDQIAAFFIATYAEMGNEPSGKA